MDQTPSAPSERVRLSYWEAGFAQPSASDLEAEITSKNLAARPQAWLLQCGGREEAPEQKATTLPL